MIALLLVGAFIALISFLLTAVTLRYLKQKAVLDHPNERSSHSTPVPRGGGLPVVVVFLIAWIYPFDIQLMAIAFSWTSTAPIIASCTLLAAISWTDDLKSLTPKFRLTIQALAVAIGIAALPHEASLFGGAVPTWLEKAFLFFGWLWFVNLFNFMDGIDGISGVETLGICAGLLLLSSLHELPAAMPWHALTVAAAILGFLWWNRPPARIFLGDVGSVPIGFILGWLLLELALAGYWASALILPAFYVCDATYTLFRRAFRGEKVWQAHREHFYQKAVQAGRSHGTVSGSIGIANVALIALSVSAISYPVVSLAGACIVVLVLIGWMRS